ncbi:MAG: hypothetical protein HYS05_11535 [Acidobacteria bacterium]|nr:hypothetical protein [Acidobacteriota bacterium]
MRIDGKPADFTIAETVLRIPLSVPLHARQSVSVDLSFDVRIPSYRDRLAVDKGNFVIGAWFPKIAVIDDQGWHADDRRGLGEFHSDVADYDVSITVPKDIAIGATGARVERIDNHDDTETSRWRASRVRDFAWIGDRRARDRTPMVVRSGRKRRSRRGVAPRLQLFSVAVRHSGHHYLVVRRDTGRMLQTSQAGVESIRLLKKGPTLDAVRDGIGRTHSRSAAEVDIMPLR